MTTKKKLSKKSIEKAITGLYDSFEFNKIDSLKIHLQTGREYLKKPSDYACMTMYPIRRTVKEAIEEGLKDQSQDKEWLFFASNLYFYYDFFEMNIKKLCSGLYGFTCSTDKASFILRSAIEWKKTGKLPVFNWKGKYTFHYPESGTPIMWMSFIEGLHDLLYGDFDKYMKSLAKIIEAKKRVITVVRGKKSG